MNYKLVKPKCNFTEINTTQQFLGFTVKIKNIFCLKNLGKQYLIRQCFFWRNNPKPFYGSEFSNIRTESLEWYELLHERNHLQKTVKVIAKVWIGLSTILTTVLQKTKEYNEHLVDAVQQLTSVFPKSLACKIVRITKATFDYRLSNLKIKCGISPLQLCFKRHPLQLASSEVQTIKCAFSNPKFSCWPAISIYYKLLRQKQLSISLSTFYKYVNILGLNKYWSKAIAKTVGIVSTKPNQYLHVDTTFWEFSSGVKAAIVFVSDNYSKAILGWEVALRNASKNVISALQKTIQTIREFHPKHICPITLVADGGSENHSITVKALLETYENPAIQKVIARKDIAFSNSPVEAINKIMKRYLRSHKPDNLEALQLLLPKIISDYQHQRPHGSLKGLTPMEAYVQKPVNVDFKPQIQASKAIRIETNRKSNCDVCG